MKRKWVSGGFNNPKATKIRSTGRTRYYLSRPRYGRVTSSTANAKASRALKLIRKWKKEEEVKDHVVTNTATIAYATTDTWPTSSRVWLNGMIQGTTSNYRIGNKITMTDLLIRLVINTGTSDTNGAVFRVVVFYDRKPAGAYPAPTTIFKTDDILSPLARTNPGRFAILYDTFVTASVDKKHIPLKMYIPLQRVGKASYGLSAIGTIADMDKGSLFLWVSGGNLDTADSSFKYNSRLKFTDA